MTEDTESVELNNARERGNMFILEPDIGLGDHIANRSVRNQEPSRREESSISFRRFLQSDRHDNRSAHPDLYSCARQDPSNEGVPINAESPDLPDFVQDHLAVEQIYFNDTTSSSTGANLPDFASLIDITRNQNEHLEDDEQGRCSNDRVPLDLPAPNFLRNTAGERAQASLGLAFDLTTDSNENNIASNNSHLPDFLSDGHFFGPDCSSQTVAGTSIETYNYEPRNVDRTSASMLKRDNDRLREELQILRSILMKKDDRIKELEDLVMALEISKLQMQTDANTQTVVKPNENSGAAPSKSKTDHPKGLDAEKLEAFSVACHNDGNPNLALKVKEMTNVSERLVRELLKIITDFQLDVSKEDSSSMSIEGQSTTTDAVKNSDCLNSSSSSMNLRRS